MNKQRGSDRISRAQGEGRRPTWRVLLLAVTMVLTAVGLAPTATAVNAEHDVVVSDDPANFTPHVEDGAVQAITQVGNTMFAAGNFTTVRDQGSTATLSRRSIFAFNATTGDIVTSFAPTFDGDINSLDTDGQYVYASGGFNTVNGQTRRKVVKLTTSGTLAPGQPPAVNAYVNEVVVRGDRLYLGGSFTLVGGQSRLALAAVNKDTGALLADVNVPFTGQYNGGSTNIKRFDVTSDGRKLVAVGNFTVVGGQAREQVAQVDLPAAGAAAVSGWATERYSQALNNCAGVFDSFVRDVDYSPEGGYFVVTTTGAFAGGAGSGTLCDTNARWETAPTTGGQQPTWASYTGGDTSYGVAITGTAVYVGGHMRWANNPFQGDQAGPGAVPRSGIMALDPVNGLPLSWNPGRSRGVGAQALFATDQGLWVGSDTDRFAGELRSRIAFLPLAGGKTVPSVAPATLPNHLYAVQRSTDNGRTLFRVNAGGPAQTSQDGGPDWAADTAQSPSPLHNAGSNTAANPVSTLDTTVPPGTPRELFNTERWDPAGDPEMQFSFPVTSGKDVQVRLYLANTCGCTSAAGQRVFDVSIDGTTVLNDLDLSGSVGHQVGTMRSFNITSDGSIDVLFGHVVENTLINAIEIIDPSIVATGEAPLTRRPADATGGPTGPATVVDSSTAWAAARGTFLVNKTLYYGTSEGLFARSFDEGTLGAVREINLYDDPETGQRIPFPTGNLTGAFYDTTLHRVYYTLAGDARLFYRYFTPESEVVGAETFVADAGGLNFSTTAGLTFADDAIFYGSSGDGNLRKAPFTQGRVSGGASVVSTDGTWRSRGLFVAGPRPSAANVAPTAEFTSTCTNLDCSFDASASRDSDGSIVSYAWNFGDNSTGTGVTPSHSYTSAGSKNVTLTVTDDDGASTSRTTAVSVTAPPPGNVAPTASFTASCTDLGCSFDGTASDDPDGNIASYDWDFGGGDTGTGATTEHTYGAAGDYTIILTVTDEDGATDTASQVVTVTASDPQPPVGDVAFVAAASSAGNATSARLALPAGVEVGDQLLLFLTTNRTVTTPGPSAGGAWSLLENGAGDKNQIQTWVWARAAVAGDAGRVVSVPLDVRAKYVMSAAAYRGAVVDSSALAAETVNRRGHTTPAVTTDDAGSWVVSYWADKTSATTDWASPTGVEDRAERIGGGSGRVTSLLADSNAPVANGPAGGLTATADASSLKATMVSVVLRPA